MVEEAEHPIKYSIENIKTFGYDVMNNKSMKDAFNSLKEDMKATINARQACIDNDYIYRTYKRQVGESLCNTSRKITTPTKAMATSAISSIMNTVNKNYVNAMKNYTKVMDDAVARHLDRFKTRNKIKEIVSLGVVSYTGVNYTKCPQSYSAWKIERNLNKIKDIDEKLQKFRLKAKKVDGQYDFYKSPRRSRLEAKKKLLEAEVDYLVSGQLSKDVWGDRKSPEEYFQTEVIPDIKNGVKAIPGKVKSIPQKTVSFIKALGDKIKNKVFEIADAISNTATKIHDKPFDIVADSATRLSNNIINISNHVNRKLIPVQAAAKANKESLNEKVETVNMTNKAILGINDETIDKELYISDATKAIEKDLEAIDKMRNPEAAKYMEMKLQRAINKDKRAIVSQLKESKREASLDITKQNMKDEALTFKDAALSTQKSLLGRLNNILISVGEGAASRKIGTVSIDKSQPQVDKDKDDIIKSTDMNKEDDGITIE